MNCTLKLRKILRIKKFCESPPRNVTPSNNKKNLYFNFFEPKKTEFISRFFNRFQHFPSNEVLDQHNVSKHKGRDRRVFRPSTIPCTFCSHVFSRNSHWYLHVNKVHSRLVLSLMYLNNFDLDK
jgi:hypothetical protein